MTELRPCPFCGGQHEWEESRGEREAPLVLKCEGNVVSECFPWYDKGSVTRHWNTRPIENALDADLVTTIVFVLVSWIVFVLVLVVLLFVVLSAFRY